MASEELGLKMTFAIAIHNIPEGIVIAAPIFAATGDRMKAFLMASASGLSEPLGAMVALKFLRPYLLEYPRAMGFVMTSVGGIMISAASIELIPEGLAYNQPRALATGLVTGSIVMGTTMLLV
jgi:ZIP family zinc transporter